MQLYINIEKKQKKFTSHLKFLRKYARNMRYHEPCERLTEMLALEWARSVSGGMHSWDLSARIYGDFKSFIFKSSVCHGRLQLFGNFSVGPTLQGRHLWLNAHLVEYTVHSTQRGPHTITDRNLPIESDNGTYSLWGKAFRKQQWTDGWRVARESVPFTHASGTDNRLMWKSTRSWL